MKTAANLICIGNKQTKANKKNVFQAQQKKMSCINFPPENAPIEVQINVLIASRPISNE